MINSFFKEMGFVFDKLPIPISVFILISGFFTASMIFMALVYYCPVVAMLSLALPFITFVAYILYKTFKQYDIKKK